VGSVLCGNQELINKARRWRKVLGGGMRQSGILAAAGIYALEHHIERLAEDHRHAHELAEGLRGLAGIKVLSVNTNMVMMSVDTGDFGPLRKHLEQRGILISGGRLVTHLDITDADIPLVLSAFAEFGNTA
jgi:threonine aldolase